MTYLIGYVTNEYEFHATIISSNRITVPDMVMREWKLEVGDVVQVRVRRSIKDAKNMII